MQSWYSVSVGGAGWRGDREGDRCQARSPKLQQSRNWVLGLVDLGSHPVLRLTSYVSLSELLNFSGSVSGDTVPTLQG